MPQIKLDNGYKNIKPKIKEIDFIFLHTMQLLLESMTWNIPTIIFLNKKYWELNDQAKIYFGLLKKLVFFIQLQAQQKMIDIWDVTDKWWYSSEIQKVKDIFINQYAKNPEDPLKFMKMELMGDD